MEFLRDKRVKKLISQTKKFQTSLVLALIGLLLIGAGLSINKVAISRGEPQFIDADSTENKEEAITIDVSGAVKKPGVYTLEIGTRIIEAIEKAGGFSKRADKNWVAKNLNLAAKLSDGEKLYIPPIGQAASSGVLGGAASEVSGKININTASESELDSLYGIGPVRANKIISNRPYSSLEELLTKKVLGEATFEKIKNQITTF